MRPPVPPTLRGFRRGMMAGRPHHGAIDRAKMQFQSELLSRFCADEQALEIFAKSASDAIRPRIVAPRRRHPFVVALASFGRTIASGGWDD